MSILVYQIFSYLSYFFLTIEEQRDEKGLTFAGMVKKNVFHDLAIGSSELLS